MNLRQRFFSLGRGAKALVFLALLLGSSLVLAFTLRTWVLKAVLEDLSRRLLGMESIIEVHQLGWTRASVDMEFPKLQMKLTDVAVNWVGAGKWDRLLVQVRNTSKGLAFKNGNLSEFSMSIDTLTHGTQLEAASIEVKGSTVRLGEKQYKDPRLTLGVNPQRLGFEFSASHEKRPLSLKYVGQISDTEGQQLAKGPLSLEWTDLSLKGELALTASPSFEDRAAEWTPETLKFNAPHVHNWLGPNFSPTIKISQRGDVLTLQATIPPYSAPYLQLHGPLEVTLSNPNARWSGQLSMGGNNPVATGKGEWASSKVGVGNIALVQGEASWKLQGGLGALAISGWQARALTIEGEWKGGEARLTVLVPGVEAVTDPVFLPLTLRSRWVGSYPLIEGSIEALDLLEERVIGLQGKANLADRTVELQTDKKWDLAEWDPSTVLALPLATHGGTMALRARVAWKDDQLKSSARFSLSDAVVDWDGVPIKGLSLDVNVSDLPSLAMKGSDLTIASLGSKLPVTAVKLPWTKTPNGPLRIKGFAGKFADGTLTIPKPFLIDLKDFDFETTLHLDNLKLQTLFEGAEVQYVSAKGTLSGAIPVAKVGEDILIRDARLKNVEPEGWLKYQNTGMYVADRVDYLDQFQDLLAQGQQALVFKALDNFFFTKMRVELNRNPVEGLRAVLTLAGRNPELGNGMPFEFNIGLSGQLENAVKRSLLRAMMSPEAFAEKVQNMNLEQTSPK